LGFELLPWFVVIEFVSCCLDLHGQSFAAAIGIAEK
jgi:hypothetical protein